MANQTILVVNSFHRSIFQQGQFIMNYAFSKLPLWSFFVLIVLLITACDQPSNAGCKTSKNYTEAKFNSDCRSDTPQGYFRIPNEYLAHCDIITDNSIVNISKSSGANLILDVPITVFLSEFEDTINKPIRLYLYAGETIKDSENCFSYEREEISDWQDILDSLRSDTLNNEDVLKKYSSTEYGILNYQYNEEPDALKYNVYLKTNQSEKILNKYICSPSIDCSTNRIPILNGHYGVNLKIPNEYETYVFEVTESVPNFLHQIYFKNQEN